MKDIATVKKSLEGIEKKIDKSVDFIDREYLKLKEKVETEIESKELESVNISFGNRELYNEAVSALFTLGYRRNEAKKAVEKILQKNSKEISIEQLIKLALKEI